MCGISGAIANHISEQSKAIIHQIVASQYRRGPDCNQELLVKGQQAEVYLGHNRLSIIDLNAHANQPMFDVTGRYCIVYNGEIYNYVELRTELESYGLQFQTRSDTEVILNAFAHWGIEALSHFNGPFAFALFDKVKDEIWLCRDRFGVRPLYYVKDKHILYFASTTSVLAKTLNLKPNMQYVARGLNYLVYEDASDISPFENLYSVPSGCYLKAKVDENAILYTSVHKYYHLNDNVQQLIETLPLKQTNTLLELIEQRLNTSLKIRLRADVPVAVSLSGGLDSSSIAALVSQQHQNMTAFSFGHPAQKHTEGPLVAACGKWLGLKVDFVWPTQEEMVNGLFATIEAQNSPFSSLSIIAQYLLYKKVHASGIKVLLGGQGGDESFMGYRKFLLFRLQRLLKQKKYFSGAVNFMQLLPMLMSEARQFKLYWSHRHRYSKHKPEAQKSTLRLPQVSLQLTHRNQDPGWYRQSQDITDFSLPTLLRYEDRNGMGHSVESRLPFMDYQLVELGLALPEALKLRAGYGKWPLRAIMRHKIPDSIRLARYKRGFDISMEGLLKEGLGHRIRQVLQDHHAVIKDLLTLPNAIMQSFSDHEFLTRRNTLTEAITLLWIINQTQPLAC